MIRRAPGVALISFAAVLWGMDALLRKPLAATTSAATIVFGEHVVLVLVVLPLLVPALLALRRAGGRAILAGAVLGAGASALATILFTQAFVHGDPITPVVLQKVQPLVAVVGARLILGEQPRRRFAWFLLPALAGVWLIAFPHPFEVHARGLVPIAEALAAAGLWGLGTVLGRYLGRRLSFDHVVTVRFAFGFVGSALALPLLSAPTHAGARDSLWIAVLALVTGAVALAIYYYGLQRTPAIVASLAELAYPLTAGIVGYVAFGAALGWSQWIGVGLTTAVVTTLPLRGRGVVRMPDADAPPAAAPAPA
jgi:drug/metabolite transporter (DMT)-like permease